MTQPKMDPLLGELVTLEELLAEAEFTEQDATNAAQAWKDNPPDPKFKLILEAESDGE